MGEDKKYSLIKPTLDTPFHIDFDWWKSHDQNWRVYLYSCLCLEHQNKYSGLQECSLLIDKVDPNTAEVTMVDGFEYILLNHCAKQKEFL